MKVKDIPYYVKFIFSGSDGSCFSTMDQELFKYIRYNQSGESITSLKIGQEIYFEPETDNKFKISDIAIRHLVDDLEILKYGIDMEDCTEIQGAEKKWLFSIIIKMDKI